MTINSKLAGSSATRFGVKGPALGPLVGSRSKSPGGGPGALLEAVKPPEIHSFFFEHYFINVQIFCNLLYLLSNIWLQYKEQTMKENVLTIGFKSKLLYMWYFVIM